MNFRMAASLFSALTGPECAKERGGMGGTTMCAGSLLSVMTPERLPAALIASVWLPESNFNSLFAAKTNSGATFWPS